MAARLAERETELELLGHALAAAAGGSGRCVLVEGEPGVGKSALLDAIAARAARARFAVWRATGSELEQHFPLSVVHQLFGGPGEGDVEQPRADEYALLRSLTSRLEADLATTPALLAVDDAQWADAASLRFLAYLSRRISGLGAVLVLTTRRRAIPAELVDLRARTNEVTRLRLQPLSREATGAITAEHLGNGDGAGATDDLVAAVHELSGGNPFLLHCLLAAHADLPDADRAGGDAAGALRAAVSRTEVVAPVLLRIDRAGPTARTVAEAIAVLGPDADAAVLADVTELHETEVLDAIDVLQDTELVDAGPPPRFRHALVQDAVRRHIPARARRALDERVVTALTAHGAPDHHVAAHLLRVRPTGDPARVDRLRSAAAHARRSGAHADAVRYLRRAVEERSDTQLLLELGSAEARAGDARRARATFEAAVAALAGPQQRSAQVQLARILVDNGAIDDAVRTLDAVLAADDLEPATRFDAELTIAVACRHRLELRERARGWVATAAAHVDADDPTFLAELAYEHALAGAPRETVIELGTRALDASGRLGATRQVLFLSLLWAGDIDGARRAARLDDDDRVRDEPVTWHRRAVLALATGDADEAVAAATKAVEEMEWAAPLLVPGARATLARALLATGDVRGAAEAVVLPGGDRRWETAATFHAILHARAEVLLARDRAADALDAARRCEAFSARMGTENPAVVPWRSLAAAALVDLGRPEEAGALLDEELVLARRFGASGPIAAAEALLARVAASTARVPPTVRLLGTPAVVMNDETVPLTRDLGDRLVRLVATRPAGIHQEELVELLWPDVSAASGRARLRNVLARARKRHGGLLRRDGDRIVIAPEVRVDLREFDRLARAGIAGDADAAQAALELYEGDLLPTDPYASWAVGPRERARGRWLELVDAAAARIADEGRVSDAVDLLQRAIDADPYGDERYLLAAAWLVDAGRRSAARPFVERARAVVVELGLRPSPRLAALERAVGA